MVCLTRNGGIQTGRRRQYDGICIDLTRLLQQRVDFYFYFHQAGQLLRQLQLWYLHKLPFTEFNDMWYSYLTPELQYQATQVEILSKRPSANAPCDPSLANEDSAILTAIIKMIACIPPYWNHFSVPDGSLKNYSVCEKKEQLQRFASFLPDETKGNYFSEGTPDLIPPCRETRTAGRVVKMSDNQINERSDMQFCPYITYPADVYKSITNEQAFNVQDLWSQIGGFVGMFLGYSLLQVRIYVSYYI